MHQRSVGSRVARCPEGLSITRLVRAELAKPSPDDPRITKAEALAARIVELARAGDRAMLARLRRRTGVDPLETGLTDDELVTLLVAVMGLGDADERR